MAALGTSPAPALFFALFAALVIGLLVNTLWLRNREILLATIYALLMGLQLPGLANSWPGDAFAGLWHGMAAVAAIISAGLFLTLVQRALPAQQKKQTRKFIRSVQLATLLLALPLCVLFITRRLSLPPGSWLLAIVVLFYCTAFALTLWQYAVEIRHIGPLGLASIGCGLFALRILASGYAGVPGEAGSYLPALLLWLEAFWVAMLVLLLHSATVEDPRPKSLTDLQHRQKVATLAPLINASRHELRAPLTDIVGLAELIGDQPLDRQQRDHLAALKNAARRALYNINDLFTYRSGTAYTAKQSSTHAEYFQPETLIEECCQYFRQQVDDNESDLVVDTHPELPFSMQANLNILRQLMLLVLEFLLAEQRVKTLLIEVEMANDECLSVTFFTDAHSAALEIDSVTRATSSAAASAFALASENGAKLQVSKGENITRLKHKPAAGEIALQLTFPVQVSRNELQQSISANSLSGRRVLIVEDSATARAVIRAHLERWDMQVHAAATAAEARALLLNQAGLGQRVDVAIVDYKLPDATALELVAALLREAAMTPMPALVIVSNAVNNISERSARNHGIHHILEKPVLAETLKLTLVESLLLQSALRADFSSAAADDADNTQPSPASRQRALLVEDDPVSRKVTIAQLTQCGWHCDTAANGSSGIARFSETDYDLVILDCNLPDISGIALGEKMLAMEKSHRSRKEKRAIFVSLSADNESPLAERSAAAGLDAHWVKPVTRADLENIARS